MPDKKTLLGIALGVGGMLAVPFAASIVASVTRPLVKGILKKSLLASERMREKALILTETWRT